MSIINSDEREGTSGATRIDVQANFYSDSLSPDEISSRLNLEPTRTGNKGPWVVPRTSKVAKTPLPHHFWQLRSEPNVQGFKFTEHMDWMLGKLFPARDLIIELHRTETIFSHGLTCVVWSSGTGSAVRLAPRHAESLALLQLALWFEFADYGAEDLSSRLTNHQPL